MSVIGNNIKSVAVLMAAYNGKEWIDEQVRSILNQKSVLISVFISIDPSSDGTEELCFDLQSRYQNIYVLPVDKEFGSAAPNFYRLISDVDFSGFDYISFADQDDIWLDDKLARATNVLINNNLDGYSSNVMAFWPDGREVFINKAQSQVEWDYLFESAGPGCTFVVTRKLANELKCFIKENETISSVWLHDWLTYAFARSRGYNWYIDEEPSMLYRQHETNQVGVNSGYKAFLHRSRFVLSGKALSQSSLIATLCRLEDNSFVKKWHKHSRLGVLFLGFNSFKCRRKYSERLIFALSCLLIVFVGNKKS